MVRKLVVVQTGLADISMRYLKIWRYQYEQAVLPIKMHLIDLLRPSTGYENAYAYTT